MSITSALVLPEIECDLHLGVSAAERLERQRVLINLSFTFATPPLGCENDNIDDALCYFTMINSLRDFLITKEFKLIESLAQTIHSFIMKVFIKAHEKVFLTVAVTKFPPIDGLNRGASFFYGNQQ